MMVAFPLTFHTPAMKTLPTLVLGLLLATAAQAQQPATPADSARTTPSTVTAAAPAADVAPEPARLECTTLTGRVTDAFAYPLTGATVMLRTGDKAYNLDAFSTNSDGRYLLTSKKPIPPNALLQISAAGYTTYEQPLKSCQPLEITLEPLPGTKFKSNGRIKKTASTGKIR